MVNTKSQQGKHYHVTVKIIWDWFKVMERLGIFKDSTFFFFLNNFEWKKKRKQKAE